MPRKKRDASKIPVAGAITAGAQQAVQAVHGLNQPQHRRLHDGEQVGNSVGAIVTLPAEDDIQTLTQDTPTVITFAVPADFWYRKVVSSDFASSHNDDNDLLDYTNNRIVVSRSGFWIVTANAVFNANGVTETAVTIELVHRDRDGTELFAHAGDHIMSTPVLGRRRFDAVAVAPCFVGDTWEVRVTASEADNALRSGVFSAAFMGDPRKPW